MTNTEKLILRICWEVVFNYLAGAVICWELNPGLWNGWVRIAMVALAIIDLTTAWAQWETGKKTTWMSPPPPPKEAEGGSDQIKYK